MVAPVTTRETRAWRFGVALLCGAIAAARGDAWAQTAPLSLTWSTGEENPPEALVALDAETGALHAVAIGPSSTHRGTPR